MMGYQDVVTRLGERTRYWIGVVSESHVKLGVCLSLWAFRDQTRGFLMIAEAMLGGSDMIQKRTIKSL